MDISCPRCGEPWDFDTLHEEASESGRTFDQVRADFGKRGCAAFSWTSVCPCQPDDRSEIRAELLSMMGDDIDGYAALCEDFGL